MKFNEIQLALLDRVRQRGADLRKVSEPYRQLLITFGMQEPPLIEVDADRVTITTAGRKLLDQAKTH